MTRALFLLAVGVVASVQNLRDISQTRCSTGRTRLVIVMG
jgi:hypothetical protein